MVCCPGEPAAWAAPPFPPDTPAALPPPPRPAAPALPWPPCCAAANAPVPSLPPAHGPAPCPPPPPPPAQSQTQSQAQFWGQSHWQLQLPLLQNQRVRMSRSSRLHRMSIALTSLVEDRVPRSRTASSPSSYRWQ